MSIMIKSKSPVLIRLALQSSMLLDHDVGSPEVLNLYLWSGPFAFSVFLVSVQDKQHVRSNVRLSMPLEQMNHLKVPLVDRSLLLHFVIALYLLYRKMLLSLHCMARSIGGQRSNKTTHCLCTNWVWWSKFLATFWSVVPLNSSFRSLYRCVQISCWCVPGCKEKRG